MNSFYIAAAALTVATGLAHTVIGEILIFKRLRRGTIVPTFGGDALRERHVRILWASWHALTLFALAMAAMLVALAEAPPGDALALVARLIALGIAAGGITVLVGTRARHPGWVAMCMIAILIELGR